MTRHPGLGYFDEGSDLTAPGFYDAARRPFGEAALLPPAAYRSKIFAELEDEKLWTRTWVCVGSGGQIPRAGDLLPFTVGHHGVHVQRAADGSLVGRFNKAQHGGCRSVPAQCQTGIKTKCSYTSCGYSRDRDVVLASELDEAFRVSNQYLGDVPERLLPVSVESLGPLVFVNLDRDPRPLGRHAAAAWRWLGGWLGAPLADLTGRWLEFECNWKLAGRGFMGLGDPGRAIAPGDADDAACAVRAVSFAEVPPCSARGALPRLQRTTAARPDEAVLCWLFPNLLLALMPDHVASVVLQPTATTKVMQRLRIFVDPAAAQGPEAERIAAELTDHWSRALEAAAVDAVATQRRAEAPVISSDTTAAPGGLGREDNPSGYLFQQHLVDAVLATHRHDESVPLFVPLGR